MPTIYQFGKFVLNVQEQSFTADGRVIHLPTKEFEILKMLVENNGRMLSKDEMMSAIWKDTFVEESNLAQYVSRLRKVLNVDGNQYIKTISKRGYRFSADVKTSDADLVIERHLRVRVGGNDARTLGEIRSVAVLPFISLGAPAGDDFFGLGITDALITQLTRTGQIITRPTTAVLRFKSPDRDLAAIADMLDVDAILEGTFQKSGDRLRLTAQMLDSQSGKTVWAESFNTDVVDIFDVQDRIAERILRALTKQHSAQPQGEIGKHYTDDNAAYEEYLKGRFNFSKRTTDGLLKALRNFERAIEIDPNYALAYAGMAEAYQRLPLADGLEPHAAFPKAKAAALRALEIDDTLPEAHVSLGVILMDFDWNWNGAELSFQRAIALNPNYPAAYQVYGTLLLRLGRIGDAIVELKKAQRLDPLSPAINTWMAEAFAWLGEYEAAIRLHNETINFAPDYLFTYYFLVQSYVSTGRLDDAAAAAEKAVDLSDDMSLTRSASIYLKAHAGDRELARLELEGLIEKRSTKYVSAVNIASGFAVLTETDRVFEWLDVAEAERDSNLTWLNIDREFDYLRDDPRFRALIKRVGLPETDERDRTPVAVKPLARATVTSHVGVPLVRTRSVFVAVGLTAVVVMIGLAFYYGLQLFTNAASGAQPKKNTPIRLTDAPFEDANPSFTRDGRIRFLRYLDRRTVATYVMNADGSDVREQTEIQGLSSGAYSPDGTKVFFRRGGGDQKFYLAGTDGSNEQVMPFSPGNHAWSPDSKQLVYQARGEDTSVTPNNSDIFIYTVETGAIRPIVESPFFDSDPSFSPDGKSIVYVSDAEGNFEIYSRVIETGETRRLTYSPGHDSFPSYSPDGTQIIFNSDVEKENNDVYLMNADGSNVRKITDGPGWDASPPNCWSADGTQVLLMSDGDGGKPNIYLMNIEPEEPRRLVPPVESDQPLYASYSPTGEKIVYYASNEIRIRDLVTGADTRVIRSAGAAYLTFSPDGSKLLFHDRIDDNTEICLVNIDGSGFINLSQHPARDFAPAFSPDGWKIAFASSRASGTATFEIYVMNADGSDAQLVFGDRAISASPAWSPDGKSIVFSNDREGGRIGNFELFSVNLDGGAPVRLTERPHYDVDGAFSPDGRRIAFASNADGNFEIYVMNADGTGLVRLTRDRANDLCPRWAPDGKKLIISSDRSGKFGLYEISVGF